MWQHPHTVVIPTCVFLCLMALGFAGVFAASAATSTERRATATNIALGASQSLQSHISASATPATTMANLIMLNPEWEAVNATFYSVAPSLIKDRERDAVITMVCLSVLNCP